MKDHAAARKWSDRARKAGTNPDQQHWRSPAGAHTAALDDFRSAFNQHLIAAQIVAGGAPGMRGSGYGRVVNVISTSVKEPLANLGVSNTVRAAMAGWAKTLSSELASAGITVNNVLPIYSENNA